MKKRRIIKVIKIKEKDGKIREIFRIDYPEDANPNKIAAAEMTILTAKIWAQAQKDQGNILDWFEETKEYYEEIKNDK